MWYTNTYANHTPIHIKLNELIIKFRHSKSDLSIIFIDIINMEESKSNVNIFRI